MSKRTRAFIERLIRALTGGGERPAEREAPIRWVSLR